LPAETKPKQVRSGTAEKLLYAAAAEFNEHGFDGTDSNRIARRAGFAPQTFYRWYEDKIEIFIKVYEYWEQTEAATLRDLLGRHADDAQVAEAMIAHHQAYLRFRRSLRQLSLEHPRVRAARAASRRRQIGNIRGMQGQMAMEEADVAAALFQMERLTDALSEGEIVDMALDPAPVEDALAAIIHRLRHPG
jgi:AcrR family transcriptional regulator